MAKLLHETASYQFHSLRDGGAALTSKRENTSVYFKPGQCAATAMEHAKECFQLPEMYDGENVQVFDHWSSQYF